MKTKRYLLFRGECYYPKGGGNDFEGSFTSLKKAIKESCYHSEYYDHDYWVHIVDRKTMKVVWENGNFIIEN